MPDEAEKIANMNFGLALQALKKGKSVSREGWNGKGQFIMLMVPAEGNPIKQKFLAISPVGGDLVPWVASQSDLLAEDWVVVE